MKYSVFPLFLLSGIILFLSACKTVDSAKENASVYQGTASVTQGLGTTTTDNLFPEGGRVASLGTITATDGTTWTLPAAVNFTNTPFPFAPDLYNDYGDTYRSASEAIAALDGSDMVEIDSGGELITAYIFADNYFEMYVNGVAVGKDPVPFTQFNSNVVRFRVAKPFTIAMKLVDWEEHLGLGTERSRGLDHHAGDGGMVAIFKDADDNVVAMTGSDWKAQTFYTSPIKDLSCPVENGTTRSSDDCNTEDSKDGSAYYGLHWKIPTGWANKDFDDSAWPNATTYTNEVIGVDNKKSYTNFTDVFDDSAYDAQFIWSTNVVLDNEVIVRYRVE